jgi:hypothetical protein
VLVVKGSTFLLQLYVPICELLVVFFSRIQRAIWRSKIFLYAPSDAVTGSHYGGLIHTLTRQCWIFIICGVGATREDILQS